MFELTLHARGINALAQDPRFPERFRRAVRKLHREAWRKWAGRGRNQPTGLMMRFSPRADGLLGLQARTGRYVERKRRRYGRALPFTSPHKKLHMRELMRREGLGWRVKVRNATSEVRTKLTLPGARVLNFYPKYAREFLQLESRGRRDATWIREYVAAGITSIIDREADRAGRKRVKGS